MFRREAKPEPEPYRDDTMIPRPKVHEHNHDGICCAHCNKPLEGEALKDKEREKWYCSQDCIIWDTFLLGTMIMASLEPISDTSSDTGSGIIDTTQ